MTQKMRKVFSFISSVSLRGSLITLISIALACLASGVLCRLSRFWYCAPVFYAAAVFFVARFCGGLFLSVASCFAGAILLYPLFACHAPALPDAVTGSLVFLASSIGLAIPTNRLAVRAKRAAVEARLCDAEQARSSVLRAASHDIRRPLTAISTSVDFLLQSESVTGDAPLAEALSSIKSETDWLIRMVENILTVTRSDGSARVEKQDELVEEVLSGAIHKLQYRYPDCRVTVDAPREPLFVPMDAILIQQVLVNLIENAILHGKNQQGIRLLVEKSSDRVVFTVSDKGCGIPAARLAHLFDPEERAGRSERDAHGMGIGLSVCKAILCAHGGDISGENTPNGATFRFSLPTKEA